MNRFPSHTSVQPLDPIHPRAGQAGKTIGAGAEPGTVHVVWDSEVEGLERETDESEDDLRAL